MESAAPRLQLLRGAVAILVCLALALGFAQLLSPFRVSPLAAAVLVVGLWPEIRLFAFRKDVGETRLLYRGIGLGALLAIALNLVR